MAPRNVTGRKPAIARAGKSIVEFCQAWGISRRTYDNWQRKGLGPAVVQPGGPGGRAIITPQSEEAWARRHTAIAGIIEAAE
jgi:hypothetical protein